MSTKRRNPKSEINSFTQKLIEALKNGASEKVMLELIEKKANVNHQNAEGIGFLMSSIHNIEVLRTLLKGKADPKLSLNGGSGPLSYAVNQGQPEAVKLLLEAKADIEERTIEGNSPLFVSTQSPFCPSSITLQLLRSGAKVDTKNHLGQTPLMIAAASGNIEKLQFLLAKGADPLAASKDGETVLHYCATQNAATNSTVIKTVIKALLSKPEYDLNAQNKFGTTALMTAARQGNAGQIQVLLEAKASAQAVDKYGHTALMQVFQRDKPDMAILQALIPASPLDAANVKGLTALMLAVMKNSLTGVHLLVEAGADPELMDLNGFRAVDLAEQSGNGDIFNYLYGELSEDSSSEPPSAASTKLTETQKKRLKRKEAKQKTALAKEPKALVGDKALSPSSTESEPVQVPIDAEEPSARPLIEKIKSAIIRGEKKQIPQLLAEKPKADLLDQEDNNLLNIAILAQKPKIAAQLLTAGIPVNQCNKNGQSPLMLAALAGYDSLVKKLLSANATSDQQDILGHTALMLAAKNGHEQAVVKLLAAKASVNLGNKSGKTAFNLAQSPAIQARLRAAKLLLEAPPEVVSEEPVISDDISPAIVPSPSLPVRETTHLAPSAAEQPEEGWEVQTKRLERKATKKPVQPSQTQTRAPIGGTGSSRKPSVASYRQKPRLQSGPPLIAHTSEKPLLARPAKPSPAPWVKPGSTENNTTALSTQPPVVSSKTPKLSPYNSAQTQAVSTSSTSLSTFASLQSTLTAASPSKPAPAPIIKVEDPPHLSESPKPAASPTTSTPVSMIALPALSPTSSSPSTNSTSLFIPDSTAYTDPAPYYEYDTSMDIKGPPPSLPTSLLSYSSLALDEKRNSSVLLAPPSNEHPVIIALREQKVAYVTNELQRKKVPKNIVDSQGNSLLMVAVDTGQLVTLLAIIHYCPVSNHKNKAGDTALLLAAKKGIPDIVAVLLKKGAVRTVRDRNGNTALMLAIKNGNDELINKFFVSEQTQNFIPDEINFSNRAGKTALFIAVSKINPRITGMLLERGANRILRDKQHYTALMRAVESGSLSLVMEFLKSGNRLLTVIPEIDFKNAQGDTALMLAVKTGNPAIVDALLKSGAKISERNNAGFNAKMLADQLGIQEIINLLQASEPLLGPSPLAAPYYAPLPQLYSLVPLSVFDPVLIPVQVVPVYVLPEPVYQTVLTAAFFQAPHLRTAATNPATTTEQTFPSAKPSGDP